ncbi:MAG: hypothetical protein EBU75_09155 [Betaproteobacteria bacterium]|nr:hypothetical protein [Betaproteobacteria bacterium]
MKFFKLEFTHQPFSKGDAFAGLFKSITFGVWSMHWMVIAILHTLIFVLFCQLSSIQQFFDSRA